MLRKSICLRSLLCLCAFVFCFSAQSAAEKMRSTDPAEAVAYFSELFVQYPDRDIARKMVALITKNLEAGVYSNLDTRAALAKALTADVRSVRRDFHLGVTYSATSPTEDAAHNLDKSEVIERLRKENFGFQEARILEGNIGFLRITALNDVSVAGDAARHAFGFLQNSDAIIIDIRGNLGGEPNMVQLIESAFFSEPTLMNTIHYTDGRENAVEEIWTDPALIPIDTLADVPLFILTSLYVASGAEDLAYALQARGRAVIVGSKTLGAAHPGTSHYRADLRLNFNMPHGYVVNPVTGGDWEGVGVTPDVEASEDKALETSKSIAWSQLGYRTGHTGSE